MTPPAPTDPVKVSDRPSAGPVESEATGLPGLKTWSGVYWLVAGCLVAWIVLLAALPEIFP